MTTEKEAVWQVAGKLLLVTHLQDVKADCLGRAQRYRDHDRLTEYGYNMTPCRCAPDRVKVSVHQIWDGGA